MNDNQHHVVVVGRGGAHKGSNLYLTAPASKRNALLGCERKYRETNGLASSVHLVSKIVFSGSEEGGIRFIKSLEEMMDNAAQKDK